MQSGVDHPFAKIGESALEELRRGDHADGGEDGPGHDRTGHHGRQEAREVGSVVAGADGVDHTAEGERTDDARHSCGEDDKDQPRYPPPPACHGSAELPATSRAEATGRGVLTRVLRPSTEPRDRPPPRTREPG